MALAATRPGRVTARRKPQSPRPRRRYNAKYVYGVGAVVLVLALWQIVAALRIKPAIILPGPTDVILAFRQLFASTTIWADLATSGKEVLYGLVLPPSSDCRWGC
jgi:ABC-type nitrate/sulfonate/bicarbonate transport system permease component